MNKTLKAILLVSLVVLVAYVGTVVSDTTFSWSAPQQTGVLTYTYLGIESAAISGTCTNSGTITGGAISGLTSLGVAGAITGATVTATTVAANNDITSSGDLLITPTGNEVHIDGGLAVGDTTAIGDNNLKVVGTSLLVGNVEMDGSLDLDGDTLTSDGDLSVTPGGDDLLLDGGLTVGSTTQAGDNNLRVEGYIYAYGGLIESEQAEKLTIRTTAPTGTAAGVDMDVYASDGTTTGAGGSVDIDAGDGAGAGANGGAIELNAGTGAGTGDGGACNLTGGTGGAGVQGDGGAVTVAGGTGGADGDGGAVNITAGNAGGGDEDGGSITLQAGAKNGSGADGAVTVNGAVTLSDRAGTGGGVLSAVGGQSITIENVKNIDGWCIENGVGVAVTNGQAISVTYPILQLNASETSTCTVATVSSSYVGGTVLMVNVGTNNITFNDDDTTLALGGNITLGGTDCLSLYIYATNQLYRMSSADN